MGENIARFRADGGLSRAQRGIGALGAIWAQDWNGVLGKDGGMCWHVPGDFRFFKSATMGHPVIMGRTSFQALGKALPGRRNIVLTRSSDFYSPQVEVASCLSEALDLVAGSQQVWICGGGQVYEESLELCDLLVITQLDMKIKQDPEGAYTFAPVIDPKHWYLDPEFSDTDWREKSGDARWRVQVYRCSNASS